MGRIVVGVDGSEPGRRALRWAIAEGRLRGARVEAVHAWPSGDASESMFGVPLGADTGISKEARKLLDAAVDAEDAAGLAEPVQRHLARGPAAIALIEAAAGAEMVVVGSRGRGGFAGLLLGSVSQQVAHHAPCPVVIVPDN